MGLGAAGNSEIRTPNLDALAASGIRFENFFLYLAGMFSSQSFVFNRTNSVEARSP